MLARGVKSGSLVAGAAVKTEWTGAVWVRTGTPGTEVGKVCAGVKFRAAGFRIGDPGPNTPDIPTRVDSRPSTISLFSSLQFPSVTTSSGSVPMFPSLMITWAMMPLSPSLPKVL